MFWTESSSHRHSNLPQGLIVDPINLFSPPELGVIDTAGEALVPLSGVKMSDEFNTLRTCCVHTQYATRHCGEVGSGNPRPGACQHPWPQTSALPQHSADPIRPVPLLHLQPLGLSLAPLQALPPPSRPRLASSMPRGPLPPLPYPPSPRAPRRFPLCNIPLRSQYLCADKPRPCQPSSSAELRNARSHRLLFAPLLPCSPSCPEPSARHASLCDCPSYFRP